MNIFEVLKLSFRNLALNKMRSFLTMLGIILGISSVVLITSLGNGFTASMLDDIKNSFNNLIRIDVQPYRSKQQISMSDMLNNSDIKIISEMPNVARVGYSVFKGQYNEDINSYTSIIGVDQTTQKMYNYNVTTGRFFTKEELEDKNTNYTIIDDVSAKLSPYNGSPIGKTISMEVNGIKKTFTIIGTFQSPGSSITSLIGQTSTSLLVPNRLIATNKDDLYDSLDVEIKNNKIASQTEQLIKNYLKTKSDKDIYSVRVATQELDTINGILSKITIFITLIAAISLIVGGIGVMNIMLVSVTERITEIGLRKSIGAKEKDIRNQFLIESSFLTLIGGIIGLSIGYLLALLIAIPFKVIPKLSINMVVYSVLVSITIGMIFGVYPAKKASKLSPMEALRKD